ncbi:substrate carrier family protein [Capsaspora owczarzaki ATCC 30864]|uniref:Substrate carrier family protein n=1 Tax=Capsaspora owczarzaki (strain ATCC 30864) TaxID=595528 RepID=A0A0D2WGK1_CAPO3|nr:substrate carrier family protein [Capsaspora owczarzaki ATCC 30864]
MASSSSHVAVPPPAADGAAPARTTRPSWQGAVAGGAGGCGAALITHPVELLKVRMQLWGELGKTTATAATSARASSLAPSSSSSSSSSSSGVLGFYQGLGASLLRQAVYTSARFGFYAQYKDLVAPWFASPATVTEGRNDGKKSTRATQGLPIYAQIAGSILSGVGGATLSCPADVVLVRMQADGQLPVAQRRNYSNVLNGIYRIAREEGVLGLYRGVGPSMYRAATVTTTQMVSYDMCKDFLLSTPSLGLKDNVTTHLLSGLCAGVVTTMIASPVDVIRTRYMNSMNAVPQTQGTAITTAYKSAIDCMIKTVRTEGLRALYKGSLIYCVRVVPHVTSMFLIVETAHRAMDGLRDRQTVNDR